MPTTREQMERVWPQATVFDHHGMTEVGPVTYQCPGRPCTLLVIESSYIAEVIDPRGDRPVSRGEVGELVLTTLGRIGSPLLRYRTGDLVRENLDVSLHDGRHEMALRGGILGRADDMVLVRGVNLYPAAVENLMLSLPEVAVYQVEVDARGADGRIAPSSRTRGSTRRRRGVCRPRAIAIPRGLQSSRARHRLPARRAAAWGDEIAAMGTTRCLAREGPMEDTTANSNSTCERRFLA